MLNRASIIGHLGADPEVRRTDRGGKVVTFRLATSEKWKDKASGEPREATEWHTIVVFNESLADLAERYLKKGARAFVEGALRTRKWQHSDGADRYSTEIVLSNFNSQIRLLDRAERQAPDQANYGTPRTRDDPRTGASGARGGTGAPRSGYDLDDDIPF